MTHSVLEPPIVLPIVRIEASVSNACNARCSFCPNWTTADSRSLPAQVWIDFASRLQANAGLHTVCITGGEPLLYPELPKLIRGMRQIGIRSSVITNGWLLTERRCDELLEAGVGELNVSLDGFQELHDEMRGVPGLFERCTAGVRYLKQQRPELLIGVVTLLCGTNLATLPAFMDWLLEELPADHVGFQAYNQLSPELPDGKSWSTDLLRRDPHWPRDLALLGRVMEHIATRFATHPRFRNPVAQLEKFVQYFEDPDRDLGIRCPAGTLACLISALGDVTGCMLDPPVGNILDHDPIDLYVNRLRPARQRARTCTINCHFLINCYFNMNWQEIDDFDAPHETEGHGPQPEDPGAERELALRDGCLLPASYTAPVPCVFLAGDTAETHLRLVGRDGDWTRQMERLHRFIDERAIYHIIVGVTQQNVGRLSVIRNKIRFLRGQPAVAPPTMSPVPLRRLVDALNETSRAEGIEFRILADTLRAPG